MENKTDKKWYEQIERYINGALTEQEIDDLWTEFLKNRELHDYFITELHFQNLRKKGGHRSRENRKDGDKATERSAIYHIWIYAMATVILVVAALQLFQISSRQEEELVLLSLPEIDRSEMAGAAIYRSAEHTPPPAEIVLNQGLVYVYENDLSLAIETFQELLQRELTGDQESRTRLNLGILFYNEGEYQKSLENFHQVAGIGEGEAGVIEKGWWYSGHSQLQLGSAEDATEAFGQVARLNGRFQGEAQRLLERLQAHTRETKVGE